MSLGAPRRVRSGAGESNITQLFDLGGKFDRNEVTADEINKLRNMMDSEGVTPTAKLLEVSREALLLLCAGFGHRNSRKTAAKFRDYFRS